MKIALLGYGRMGQEIEKIALSRGHEIVLKAEIKGFSDEEISIADVAIDFSVPESAFNNIKKAIKNNIPIISGTTGWLHNYDDIVDYCNEKKGAFIYASNFSLGVNIFFELNKKLAKMISPHNYSVEMEEIHHTKKLDAPSGTAITLAEGIIENSDFTGWKLDNSGENEIAITAKRIENIPGTHTVTYNSEIDDIEIKHTAHNRKGFALGAVVAAEWLVDKEGVFSMKDVLGL
ncbi:MAG: 4-hydroxy-tetrahydrodipicolinate reductase [Bacteroidota bacterium]